jgi:tRNA A-37 threonylcarbamoyl transferase component Bud32
MGGTVQPGEVLDGKYAVERIIGRGGSGYVAAAQHLVLQQRVALKFLRPELGEKPDVCRRFLREAQAAARMKGEHVARVLDADTLQSGEPYLVMEYLEGEDVAALLRRRERLTVAEATDYVLQACEAVHEAHTLRIIHRDVKPANLFLTRTPEGTARIKVLDFGLSKVLGWEGGTESLTDSNHIMGSPYFMSPEQIRTPREVDERTDIWSLGATLFNLLTGHVPFDGASMMEVCAALLCGPAPQITRFRSDVPPQLEVVVLRCLRIEPQERHGSVVELARELIPFAPESSRASLARMEAIGAASGAAPRAPGDGRRTRLLAAGGVAIALLAITCLGVAHAISSHRAKEPPVADRPAPPPAMLPSMMSDVARSGVPAASSADEPQTAPEGGLSHDVAEARVLRMPPRAAVSLSAPPRKAAVVPAVVASAAHSAPAACSEPFYIDAQGLKAIRPGCL